MSYLLALDQGTTSSRALLFTLEGRPVAVAQQEFGQLYPAPGLVEHDPLEIWRTQLQTAREVLRRAGVDPKEVVALGLTNQRETTLVWERKTGKPLHNALVWQDRRTASLCEVLKARGLEPLFRERTGLLLDPYFSGTKLLWLLENVPGLRERAEQGEVCFGTVDTWLIYNLTGGRFHATDPSNASRTLLFNLHTLSWDEDLLQALGIPQALLPEVRPSDGEFGETLPELLGAPIPIRGVLGDQQAALFGQAALEAGQGKCTYGTGAFLLLNTGERPVPSQRGLLTTVAWSLGGRATYALEGSVFIAGAAIQWLRDLGLIRESREVEALAREVEDAGGVYFVPAFTGLGAPYWDPYARGLLIGLTRGTGRAHLARAALEGVAFQVRDVFLAMGEEAGLPLKELRADGGMAANDFFLALQADLLGTPVLRPEVTETTALGAALMAGVGAGALDLEGVRAAWREAARFLPTLPEEVRRERHRLWQRAVERALGWAKEG
ncbi:glycerol kinase GlpK [Thermus filiformis]|uniref:Glycerol kinase n=1 Tax=Thermus filiformis TaxID=276 RepID=A0A0A2WXQ8_THEFI|nr:glycerol kinase GlpK [Thermus filiformis]KGQ23075.2 glycerol kinase [Thermus filiformis]